MGQFDYSYETSQYTSAMRSLRAARNLLAALVLLAILVQLAGFILVNFTGVLDAKFAGSSPQAATLPSEDAAQPADDTSADIARAALYEASLNWALPAAKFIAMVSAILLSLIILLAVKVSLLGRLTGMAKLISAFLWSLVLLMMVTPWQQVLSGSFASGALFNLGELLEYSRRINPAFGAKGVTTLDLAFFYARFAAYPALALLVWCVVFAKFARGCATSIALPMAPAPADPPEAFPE